MFTDLSKNTDLLKNCLLINTQSISEMFNHIISRRIPESVFFGIGSIRGIHDAISTSNDSNLSKCDIPKQLRINPGPNIVLSLRKIDSS